MKNLYRDTKAILKLSIECGCLWAGIRLLIPIYVSAAIEAIDRKKRSLIG